VHDRRRIEHIIQIVLAWATAQPKLRAAALVGSHARGEAHSDSDIDLILLGTDPDIFRKDISWVEQIDWHSMDAHPQKWRDEDYSVAWSRRIWLAAASMQVELTFAPISWASVDPPDAGTRRVISEGCQKLARPRCVVGSPLPGRA